MSAIRFRGDAPAVAQVNTVTPDTVTVGNTFSLVCNGKTITFTATAATVANVTAGLVALVNASTIAEFQEVTATDNTTAFTLTARKPGVNFTITSSAATGAGSAGCHLVTSFTTVSSGPTDLSTLTNYTGGALPTGSDTLIFDGAVNAYYGLAAMASAAPVMIFNPGWTGSIGLPVQNTSGYAEYRPTHMQSQSTSYTNRSQSGRLFVDGAATNSITFNNFATGNPNAGAGELYAVKIRNFGTGCTLNAQAGSIGLAPSQLDSWAFATINVGSISNPAGDVTIFGGLNGTWTTINQNGGTVTMQSNGTTWNMPSAQGRAYLIGTATLTTLNNQGAGTFYWQSTGTIGAITTGPKAFLDSSQVPSARTATNATYYPGATINDPEGTITYTNPFLISGGGIQDLNYTGVHNAHVQFS